MPSSYNALLDMVYRELTDTLAATFYRSPVEALQQWKPLRRGNSIISGYQNPMNYWQRYDATYG